MRQRITQNEVDLFKEIMLNDDLRAQIENRFHIDIKFKKFDINQQKLTEFEYKKTELKNMETELFRLLQTKKKSILELEKQEILQDIYSNYQLIEKKK